MTGPWRPRPGIVPGTAAHRLLRGVLRMDLAPPHVAEVVLHAGNDWIVSLLDTGVGTRWETRGDTTLHVLWEADEDDAWVEVDGERYAIAPGDTMSVPGAYPVSSAAGMIMARIEARAGTLPDVLPPNHGVETFEGYNRRTDYDTPDAFALARWKITQPLVLPAEDVSYAVVALAAPLAMTWPGGTDLVGRGECQVVPPGAGTVTLVPDGLGYALVVR